MSDDPLETKGTGMKLSDLFGIDPEFVAAPSDYEQGVLDERARIIKILAEPKPEPAPPEPKFKVGDRVIADMDNTRVFTITKTHWHPVAEIWAFTGTNGNDSGCTYFREEKELTLAPTDDEVIASLVADEYISFEFDDESSKGWTYFNGGDLLCGAVLLRLRDETPNDYVTNIRRCVWEVK